MIRGAVAASALMAAVVPLWGAAEWTRFSSANFDLYTSAGERDARQTIENFEQVRGFFMRVKSSKVTTRLPVTIVGFGGAKEYKPYRLNDFAAAYYIGDENRDYIVMSGMGLDQMPVAIHEYMHLLIRHSGLKLPVWLNEGFADVYSTLKPSGGQILLGSVPPGRANALNQMKWMTLPALFAVKHDSAEYNEKDRAGILYGQSWLLTHMLMLGDRYGARFPDFVAAISSTGSAEDAFEKVYGKQSAQVEKDLQAYFRSNSLMGVLFKERFEKVRIEPPRPATELETGLTLAKLNGLLKRYDESASQLQKLAERHPGSYEIPEALAHLHWRKGDREAARRYLAAAVDLKPSNWKTYWDYARLVGGGAKEEERYEMALRKTIDLNPELPAARLRLGQHLYRKRSWAQALAAFQGIRNIEAEQASSMFLMMAYSSVQLQMNDAALRHATDAKKWARDPAETEAADRLLSYLNRPEAATATAVEAVEIPVQTEENAAGDDADERRPELRRRALVRSPDGQLRSEPHYLTLTGRLTQLDCLGKEARLHVAAPGAKLLLLIQDPQTVVIRNSAEGSMELTCGSQNRGVVVDYVPRADTQHNTAGDVSAITFTK